MIFDLPASNAQRPAIIVPVVGTTPQVVIDEAIACEKAGADVVEFRLDFLLAAHPGLDVAVTGRELLRELFSSLSVPILLTVRTMAQGGEVDLTPFRYRVLLATLLDILMQEEFPAQRVGLDLEFTSDATPDLAARAVELGYTPVISHHEWAETPDCEVMYVMLEDMLAVPSAIPKLAVMASNEDDTTNLLDVTKQVSIDSGRKIITIAMGQAGVRSRLEGWKYGSVATFATAGSATAPGQPAIGDLLAMFGGGRAQAGLAHQAEDLS
ncbi:type I 3-dehydroquinate dehydratase [Trueperella pyogenes]|uniref:type I 3-dehydroquinate dehydratase n=1 Tax=Trueperella pyogenes TaxID=1661 RepID=UPI001670DAAE|nr:type I 3-dehydroquinate dehydratase [Trueperella pyogenes]